MASTIITHIIGSTILIGVLIATTLYSGYLLNIVKTNNLSEIYRALAERIASDLRTALINAYMKNINNTMIQLILPVEAASLEGYNVYIGKGDELIKLFPRLSNDPSYNSDSVYVVVSSPDQVIYSYSLVVSPNDLPVNVLLARGKLLIEREKVGFDPARGYSEGGVPWLCRQAFNITERSGVNVSSFKYLVNISINPSNLTCRYGDLLVTPKPDGSDIRFTMDDGVTPLRYWIESWSPSKAIVWVEIPNLSPNSNRTIYIYWGAPFAVDRSDKSIFPFYDDLDKYISKDDLKDAWGVISENTSYTVYGNGSWLVVSATYSDQGYVNIFSRIVFNTSMYPGLIAEFYGAPIDTGKNSVNYKAGFYAEYPGFSKYNITFIPKVIDPTTDLVNYTIIYGNWSIGLNETTLNRYLDAYNYTYANQKYIALAVRQNPAPSIPPGQEYYQILYKVRVLNDSVYRGIYVAEENTTSTKYYGFLLSWSNTSGLCLYGYWDNRGGSRDPAEGNIQQLGSTPCNQNETLDENGKWYYILLEIRSPGSANPEVDVLVYDEDGNTILTYSRKGTEFALQPNYVGPLAVSMGNPPQYNSSFDDLVSARSDRPVDLKYINVTGIPEGWSACLSDAVYDSNTSNIGYTLIGCGESDNGVAIIDVSTHPILGVLAPPLLQIFDDSSRLVASIPIYANISGGTVIKYTGLSEDGGLVSALTKGVDGVKCNNANIAKQYLATYRDDSTSLCSVMSYSWAVHATSIGYYNGSFYYFIDGQYFVKYGSKLPVETLRLVFGVESSNRNTNTTGIYKWVRVRPFVYPEPLVTPWGTPEGAQVPKPPTLAIDSYQGYIVFSSKLLVDLGIMIRGDGVLVVVVIIHGVRSA